MKKYFRLVLFISFFGCSTSPQLVNMIPDFSEISLHKSDKSITIKDIIGGQMGEEWGSRISAADYLSVLEETIKLSEIFILKYNVGSSDYALDIIIINQDQPMFGLNMTVKLAVEYKLYDSNGDEIWNEQIFSEYTAEMCDSFTGAARLNMANEGAVRENVKTAIAKISNLKL